MFNNVFNKSKVIVTGHTGFKGSWLSMWLKKLGAEVIGISLGPLTNPSNYEILNISKNIKDYRIDVCNFKLLKDVILETKPDFIFHLAAQSLVRNSYTDTINTWKTNVIGTLNLLESLRFISNPCITTFITSDKCYNNKELDRGYCESDELGGSDPYSASKGSAELVIRSFYKSFFSKKESNIRIASARAGNVIGGGDWSEDRIVPDCIRAWSNAESVKLRNPHSTRPWQFVLEPLSGYLTLASLLKSNFKINGESYNFGPSTQENYSVIDLVEGMTKYWKVAKFNIIDDFEKKLYESKLLKLNCEKALNNLDWHSTMDFNETAEFTIKWYKCFYENRDNIIELTNSQIKSFTQKAKSRGLKWAQ